MDDSYIEEITHSVGEYMNREIIENKYDRFIDVFNNTQIKNKEGQ